MNGMSSILDGQPEDAPNWLEITENITDATWGDIMYGIAGVRTNQWTPDQE